MTKWVGTKQVYLVKLVYLVKSLPATYTTTEASMV